MAQQTPKEKAVELVNKYRDTIMSFLSDNMKDMNAKKCALIAVDEIMESNADFAYSHNTWGNNEGYTESENYWQEVKQEIEKL